MNRDKSTLGLGGAAGTETSSVLGGGGCWLSDQMPHFADGAAEAPSGHLICPQPHTGLRRLLRPNG